MIELLIALVISAALMTASLAALDASYKQYKSTTESAASHVVSRIVIHRVLSMIRTGADFGPIPPDNPYDSDQNPVDSDYIEFVSQRDLAGGIERITRIEYRPPDQDEQTGSLWLVQIDPNGGDPTILQEHPLLRRVLAASFTLRYDPQSDTLERATLDMTVEPDDSEDLRLGVTADAAAPETIRLVASASPRQLM